MSMPVLPGAQVTLLLPDHVVMAEVSVSTRLDFMVTLSSRGVRTYESRWRLENEGSDWLRGYHLADSPQVQACRTAQALSKRIDPPQLIDMLSPTVSTNIASGITALRRNIIGKLK